MKKIEILRIESLSRAPLVIEGYFFEGSNPKAPSVAIVGAMEGNTILPLYCAASMVDFLHNKLKSDNKIKGNILIIPSINHYALNIGQRFWPLDKTDLNMMFPGYEQGETTQRIAKKIFDAIRGYTYGISLETRPDPAICIPYIKLFKSEYEDLESAKRFGFKIIHHRTMKSIDTVSLQYNWQLWGTKAYSIMCPSSSAVDDKDSSQILQAIIRFLGKSKVIDYKIYNGYESNVINKDSIKVIKTPKSGIFIATQKPGNYCVKGEVIGKVVHSLEGEVIHQFSAPCDGMITCIYAHSLIFENAVAFRIAQVG